MHLLQRLSAWWDRRSSNVQYGKEVWIRVDILDYGDKSFEQAEWVGYAMGSSKNELADSVHDIVEVLIGEIENHGN